MLLRPARDNLCELTDQALRPSAKDQNQGPAPRTRQKPAEASAQVPQLGQAEPLAKGTPVGRRAGARPRLA